jgi:hypothetical protein
MAGAEKFLEAYVEISVRGMEKVDEAMRMVEERVRGVSGGSSQRRSRSDEERIRADEEKQAKEAAEDVAKAEGKERQYHLSEETRARERMAQESNKRATADFDNRNKRELDGIKARLLAEEEGRRGIEKATSKEREYNLKQELKEKAKVEQETAKKEPADWMELFGSGAPPRRVFAHMFTQILGESAIAEALGGMAGLVFGGVFLRMGWILGQMLSKLPGEIGKEQGAAARYSAGALTVPDKKAYWDFQEEQRHYWAGMEGGWDEMRQASEFFKVRDIKPEIAIPALTRFGILAHGTNETNVAEIAKLYSEMRDLRTPESRIAMLQASPLIRKAAQQMTGLTAPGQEKALESLVGTSWGVRDIDYAIDKAARREVATEQLSAVADRTAPFGAPFWRRAWDRFISTGNIDILRDQSSKFFNPLNRAVGLPGTPLFETPELLRTLGPEQGPWGGPHPELTNRQYQFTTFSGLAEMMQMQASQMGGFEEQNATNLQEIAKNTAEIAGKPDPTQLPGGGGGRVPMEDPTMPGYWK